MELNGITNADKILAGESLKIPPAGVCPTTVPSATTAPATCHDRTAERHHQLDERYHHDHHWLTVAVILRPPSRRR